MFPNIEQLKKYNRNDLKNLCNNIRDFIINLSKNNSIHLSSNLGIVELTVGLHYVFDVNKDKFIFDIGHQSYVHKILTNRSKLLKDIGVNDNISCFQSPSESITDISSFGHSSVSLSFVSGIIENINNDNFYIPIIGDASIFNGVSFEALTNISFNQSKIIIILNDNQMSISTSKGLVNMLNDVNKAKIFFNAMNIDYVGLIDGNNIDDVIDNLTSIKNKEINRPILLHFKTQKGKGLQLAENDKLGIYHNCNLTKLESKKTYGYYACQKLMEMTNAHNDIFVLNPAMTLGSGFIEYENNYPNNFEDVGICESHCVSKACGLYYANKKPYVVLYSTFLTRAIDQIQHDVAKNNIPVTFLVDRSDIAYYEGDSHHGIYDISFLKSFPNLIISSPSNKSELDRLIELSYYNNKNPMVIRYCKNECKVNDFISNFNIGDWVFVLKNNNAKTLIISYGHIVNDLYEQYKYSNLDILNAIFLTNYNQDNIIRIISQYQNIYVVEKTYFLNCLYFDLLHIIYKNNINVCIESIAINVSSIGFGNKQLVDKKIKIDIESIVNRITIK